MDVSVIIVNYNTRQMTAECIDSVFEKTSGIDFEIILVDNASTDGSKEYFEKDCRIKYIYNDKNLGFSQANNLGVKISCGRNILLLNSDTILINNAIKILCEYLDESQETAVVGGNLYNSCGLPTISFERNFPGIFYTINLLTKNILNKLRYGKNYIFNYNEKPIPVAYISGADLMIKHSVYDNFNGLSNAFFMYYEETDLCYRISKCNFKIMSVPSAKIIHLEGGSQNKNKEAILKKEQIQRQSRRIYICRNHSKTYCLFDKLLIGFLQILKKGKSFLKDNREKECIN